jgi:hypothetical protein
MARPDPVSRRQQEPGKQSPQIAGKLFAVLKAFRCLDILAMLGGIVLRPFSGLEDSWQRFGIVLEDNVIGTWDGGSDPTITHDGHKIWIISKRIR